MTRTIPDVELRLDIPDSNDGGAEVHDDHRNAHMMKNREASNTKKYERYQPIILLCDFHINISLAVWAQLLHGIIWQDAMLVQRSTGGSARRELVDL